MDIQVDGWQYYNHAFIPTTAPHEMPNLAPINDGSIWLTEGATPLLARWTTDWDCGYETNWWYVIKDTPFDVSALKAKRRYEITKGNKNFKVEEINPIDWCEDIFHVVKLAYETYPESYRPVITHDEYVGAVRKWKFYKVYGAFDVEDKSLCGFACLKREGVYIDFCMLKAIPARERLGINAAIVNKILLDHNDFLNNHGYICDGARSVVHETAFQDYLEKYFGFRKAYCKLHIVYSPKFKWIINIAYHLRKTIRRFDQYPLIRNISALLKMEEINRLSM